MTKPRIYFDIDKTMIDTKQMLQNIELSVEKVGISREVFVACVEEYLNSLESKTYFDPENIIQKLLSVSSATSEDTLREAVWNSQNFSHALFPEVISVLNKLQLAVELGTFSQGVRYWQERKLELSRLSPFFPEQLRIIAENKLSQASLARLQHGSWVIDDKEEVVEQLRQLRPDLTVLRIDRRPDQLEHFDTITSLTEVITRLKL